MYQVTFTMYQAHRLHLAYEGRYYYHPHFTDEESKAQRGE